MSKTICIVTQSHLCRNPRVLKEAIALSKAGYSITILTAIYSDKLLQEDLELLNHTTIRLHFYSDLSKGGFNSFMSRLIRKLSVLLKTKLNMESRHSLGYNAIGLKKHIKNHRAHLYIMHQELATVIGSQMTEKYKVAFDLEDWYSEDLLPGARKARPAKLLKQAEKTAIEKSACCYTTSKAMAKGLKTYYKTGNEPAVIYNSFDLIKNTDGSVQHHDRPRLYWFSQTIGEGRGLEFFINCLSKSDCSWELNLRGDISETYSEHLNKLMSPKNQLVLLPMQNNTELIEGIPYYDIGLALEPNDPPNKNLTISNKLFHCMAAGLPVIASYTEGQAEIGLENPEIIFLYKQNDERALVDILNNLGGKFARNELNQLRTEVVKAYQLKYSWEIESKKLVQLIHNALEQ
ncbi:hypothetical protein [Mucilaginibacter pocheonensis]|uniref:Glycosyltransferase involved in cell wall biosynthesis n=1 Tax=Mucilaginibacter pocheonensis TaxID=398050 RepID=A0ABU1T4T6_9SPHI|nr:hypothetical protein [Mucilaginibacter pocheonensis]MDR6940404.1 glycosyltransferase involved in cell wall biosynthesis [Mucilaginibacter pocheonensis]